MTLADADRDLVVLPASVDARRALGSLAWVALEALAFRARLQDGSWLVDANVRTLASDLGVGKDRSAAALRRLVQAGLVHHRPSRVGGRYASSTYVLDAAACAGAGLRIAGSSASPGRQPCSPTPCPDPPDTAPADTAKRGMRSPATGPAGSDAQTPSQSSLFDVPIPTPHHSLSLDDAPHPEHSTPHHDPDPIPLPLTTPNETDALAPGVLPVAFSRRSGLNGNVNGDGPPC